MNDSRSLSAAGICASFAVSLGGCVAITLPGLVPPPEAILAGTWELMQGEDASLGETLWVFDGSGNLVELRTTIGAVTVTERALVATTNVNDDLVVIQVGFAGSTMSFSGTLNADRTQATGTLSTEITFLGTTITIDGGLATLVKRAE